MNINQRLGMRINNTKPVPTSTYTPVKPIALVVFKYLRLAGERTHKLPGLIQKVSTEIAAAWQESANPKS